MDWFDFSKLIVILIIFLGSTLVYPELRAFSLLVIGCSVLVLALKAKKSAETENPDEDDKSWMIGCIFGGMWMMADFLGVMELNDFEICCGRGGIFRHLRNNNYEISNRFDGRTGKSIDTVC